MDDSADPYEKYISGLQHRAGTSCVVCEEGTRTVSTFTKTRKEQETTLVVKNVPALICDACGDVTYTQAIGHRLDELLEAAVAADRSTVVLSFRRPPTA